MKLLDLFAGIGVFSLAAHWMGWETVAFVEKDLFCQKVLIKNFNAEIATAADQDNHEIHEKHETKPKIYEDIFDFSGKPFRGRIDIVTGGFPCQPFSAAGKRKGRNDERHLFPEMLRVIREVKPRWVVAENVRGLLSIESGRVFAEVIASLEGEGLEVVTFCVPASAVEAPHRRDRLWIVANAISRGCGEERLIGSLEGIQRGRAIHSAMLPTPTGENDQGLISDSKRNTPSLATQIALLPTPRSVPDSPASHNALSGRFREQMDVALNLIATPNAGDAKGASANTVGKGRNPLTNSCMDAVENSPDGTRTGLKLQPGFVEWMMGYPIGYTEIKPSETL